MNIKHNPLFDTEVVQKYYYEKDGVEIKYVCTSSDKFGSRSMDIFYRADGTPHPVFKNRYFGLYPRCTGEVIITNADWIEDLNFALVQNDDGDLEYSENRHTYKLFNNGNMIDGGRAYVKTNPSTKCFMHEVKNGCFQLETIS
jgi:hypothetical protein